MICLQMSSTLNLFPLLQRVNVRYYTLCLSIFTGDKDIGRSGVV